MRRILSIVALIVLGGIVWFWVSGGFDQLGLWAAQQQRGFQNDMAGALRATRAGQAGAVAAVLIACFSYGVVHAAGPGHGKVLIGGYGMGRKVPMLRLSGIALAASLGQAVTAIALVYAGVALLDLGREAMIGVTERVMAPLSYLAIALIGGWLVWRGARRLRVHKATSGHDHTGHDHHCDSCGHAHGPSLEQVSDAGTLREAMILIAGIAVRPCTGALFVLIITWQMGIGYLGIAGAFAMAVGTGLVTVAVGLLAGGLRGSMLAGITQSPRFAQAAALVELLAGVVVVVLAGGLLIRAV